VWDKLVRQDLVKSAFWEGGVTDEFGFLAALKNKGNHPVFFVRDGTPVGFAFLSLVTGNYAFGHFCLFKEVWGKESVEVGKNCIEYWFSWPGLVGPLLDVIIGLMTASNVRAHKYIEKLGFTRLGTIPNMFKNQFMDRDDAVIYFKTR
jgi:RimJ/RimL family protein N-acetyltransferase